MEKVALMPRFLTCIARCILALGIVCTVRVAHADEPTEKAAAEALYQLGQQLMKSGDYANACAKLEASESLDPGVGTLLVLGDCQEKLGKIASAWATFREAFALATAHNESDRARIADIRAAALKPRLVNVVFNVPAANDVSGFELQRNGLVIAKGSWGVALPVDPGKYQLRATAPRHEPWQSTLEVPVEREAPLVVQVPVLRAQASAAPASNRGTRSTAPFEQGRSAGASQKTWGAVVGVVGAAALVTSGVFAFMASQKNNDSKAECDSRAPNLCSPKGVSLREDAQNWARLSTVFGIGGGAALAAGTVIYLTAPGAESGKLTGLTIGVRRRF